MVFRYRDKLMDLLCIPSVQALEKKFVRLITKSEEVGMQAGRRVAGMQTVGQGSTGCYDVSWNLTWSHCCCCCTFCMGWQEGASMEEIFRYFDSNRDGLLSLAEMEEGLRKVKGIGVSRRQRRACLLQYDRHLSGWLA